MNDLKQVKTLAMPVRFKELPIEKVKEKNLLADEYREAGFEDVAKKLTKEMAKQMKLARIAEFGYKVLYQNHFQEWLDGLASDPAPRVTGQNLEWQLLNMPTMWGAGGITNTTRMAPVVPRSTIRVSRSAEPQEEAYVVAQREIRVGDKLYSVALEEVAIEKYKHIPPTDVLPKIKEAQDRGLFDTITIMYPTAKEIVEDPLVLGKIDEEPGKWFYIAEWGDDISIDQLLK